MNNSLIPQFKPYMLFGFVFFFSFSLFAQVGIGNTNPAESSLLDIRDVDNNKGILIPRVSLTNLSIASPVNTATIADESLLVYNTNDITGKGFYYWSGTRWTRIDGGKNWSLNGNSGTIAGTDFLGTTDNTSLRFKTSNTDRFEISNGNAQNGGRLRAYNLGSALQPTYSWSGDFNTGIYSPDADQIGFSTAGAEKFRISSGYQVLGGSNGSAALPFYSFSTNTMMGIYGIGTNVLGFSTLGTERMSILANGNVQIGTGTANSEKLQVNGNLRLNGAFMPNNIPGGNDKILLSKGAGTAPAWGPGFLNTAQITNIGKFFVPPFNSLHNQYLKITLSDPNMTVDTALVYNFIGPLPTTGTAPKYGYDVTLLAEAQNGQILFHIYNFSGYNLSNLQIVYTAFYH